MSLKWAINGVLDDIYFMAQGLPRVLFTWKPENQHPTSSYSPVLGKRRSID